MRLVVRCKDTMGKAREQEENKIEDKGGSTVLSTAKSTTPFLMGLLRKDLRASNGNSNPSP